MRFETVQQLLAAITPDPREEEARQAAHRQWASIAKPLDSLGLLETAVEDIAALTLDHRVDLSRRSLLLLCADNGVLAQGVAQSGHEVTAAVARNAGANRSSVCKMAAVAGCRVVPVDMGMKEPGPIPGVLDRRLGDGTGDITQGPAMTRAQAERAILTGAELALEQKAAGVGLLATGEMGIGNTTTSSAVAAALLERPASEMTGKGAGLSDEGLRRKIEVIDRALARHRPDPGDPVDVISKVGGYDIAAMTGFYLGCALHRVPAVMDGFISTVAALAAVRLCPAAGDALIASHLSAEPGAGHVMEALGLRPLLRLGMALGEGTGAVSVMPLIDMALRVYFDMPSFDNAGIEAYQPL